MNAILKPVPSSTLDDLIAAWRGCKAAEKQYNQDRLAIEEKILGIVGVRVEGSEKLDGLTIQYGLDRKWDQEQLIALQPTVKPEYWPFKTEYKEDRKAAQVIEDRFPELWEEIKTALTTKQKKPSFSIKE